MANPKYLDSTGVGILWELIKEQFAAKGETSSSLEDLETALNAFIAQKGANSGLAPLDASGQVPTQYLPSYVDDVLEFANRESFPASGEDGKIYVAEDTNITYRWSGENYVEISASLALGETSSTAYAGNKGKANADAIAALKTFVGYDSTSGDSLKALINNHIANKNNPHSVTKAQIGLSNVDNTSDANKPISTATQNALNKKVNSTDVYNGQYRYTIYQDTGDDDQGNDGALIIKLEEQTDHSPYPTWSRLIINTDKIRLENDTGFYWEFNEDGVNYTNAYWYWYDKNDPNSEDYQYLNTSMSMSEQDIKTACGIS